MKVLKVFILAFILQSCEVCKECQTTYYDNNGVAVQTVDDEICGTNKDIKDKEGVNYVNGVKTLTKCR